MKATQIVQQCTAGITINRNKIKKYNENQFYLKDKQEFEIEIRNTLSFTVLATIKINGSLISNSGLVIKPGQKVYLERYIDTNRKFAFETYEVENNSHEVAKAIANNGNIEISFYKEKQISQINYVPTTWNTDITSSYIPYQQDLKYRKSLPSFNTMYCNSFTSSNLVGKSTLTSTSNTATYDWMEQPEEKLRETGRVEQGSISNQKFDTYKGDFESYSFQTTRLKLLPFSAKPIEIGELAQYCTECGTKNKKGNFKFCPKCGTKY